MLNHTIILDKLTSMKSVIDLIDLTKYENVFNPSFLLVSNRFVYLTFRAFSQKKPPLFNAYLIKYDSLKKKHDEINISNICLSYNIDVCSDPKLLTLDNEVWLTFNTGYSHNLNSIYLMKISDSIEQPYECVLENRKKVEKNWAFFKEENKLKAIYSLVPFIKLHLSRINEEKKIFHFNFVKESSQTNILGRKKNLTIGTQLTQLGEFFYLIAHEKIRIGSKRIYFGHFVSIKGSEMRIHSSRIFHSYRSLLGSTTKFNKNLISCTYFSGLEIEKNDFLISYGINDVDFDIKRIPIHSIWS